jgi:hypothetical protein
VKRSRALGITAGFASAPFVYAVVRVLLARLHPEPDPGAVIWAEFSPTVTRLVVWCYASAVVLLGTLALAGATPRAMPRIVGVLASASALAVIVQSVWWP